MAPIEMKELRELCDNIVDCPHSTPEWSSTGFVVLRSHNVRNGRLDLSTCSFTDEPHFRERTRRLQPQAGDLVITREAPMGQVAMIPAGLDCCLGQRMVLLRPSSRMDGRYLLYALQSRVVQEQILWNEGTGSTVSNLRIPLLERLRIPTPERSVQERIAQTLGTIDDKIELNRRTNETLEAMARTLFKSWFVDFDPVRAKADGRQPSGVAADDASLFPSKFVQSPLGSIPLGWRSTTIRDLSAHIQYGLTRSASDEPVGPQFLRITDIQGGRVDWANVPYCAATPDEWERYRLKSGDILVARTGASTGENIYLSSTPDRAVFASYLVRFQFADNGVARVVGAFMRTREYFDHVANTLGGSAQPNASAQVLAAARLVMPSADLAARYAAAVAPLDQSILANSATAQTLASLRDALLPRLLSGELRVRDAERIASVAT